MSTNFENIYEYIKELFIIDTHDHLQPEESFPEERDLLETYLSCYIASDVQVSGMRYQKDETGRSYLDLAKDPTIPVMDRWKLVEPYWENSRYTGYAQALDITARDLYGVERIDASTIEELSKKFTERNRPGYYHKVLKEYSKIEKVVNDLTPDVNKDFPYGEDPLFCLPVKFPYFWGRSEVLRLEWWTNMRIRSLQDLDDACEKYVDLALQKGCVGLKLGYAYETKLNCTGVSRAEAEAVLVTLLDKGDCTGLDLIPLQKYIGQRFLELADKHEMVVQVHTGLLEGAWRSYAETLPNSNPLELEQAFRNYPHIKFDLLHVYPFQKVGAALAKMYPNVYLDMGWTHAISPVASVRMLEEWIESVPTNKIMGFGGDYTFVDGVYGHQHIARKDVALALAGRMDAGLLDLTDAKKLAKDILYNNPKELFRI